MKKGICIMIPFVLSGLCLAILFHLINASSVVLAAPSQSAVLGVIIVDTLDDKQNAAGDCSLREAILAANLNVPVDGCLPGSVLTDTITFNVSGIITVTKQLSVTAGGPLIVDGAGVITTSGDSLSRVWWMAQGSNLVLKNIAVADGYVLNDNGAGVYNDGGSLSIIQCDFVNNRFDISGSDHYYGGGVYAVGGSIDVMDSFFLENGSDDRLSHGGGIAAIHTYGHVLRTTFRANTSVGCLEGIPCFYPGGGGLYLENTSLMIQDSSFISNSSLAGGGIYNTLGSVTISGTTFTSNTGESGGGISNHGDMVISGSMFSNNHITGGGGGISNTSHMTITHSTFISNTSYSGGAIWTYGVMNVSFSTFMHNNSWNGGAIGNMHRLTITGSTFSNNTATGDGGAIIYETIVPGSPREALGISNSTFSDNTAGDHGGAISNNMLRINITNSTITGDAGGIIYNLGDSFFTSPMTLTNSIIAGSTSGGNCNDGSFITDGGHNISSDGSCGLDAANDSLPNTDPKLGPLQDNGGPTWTHALIWSSPAIDAGNDTFCPPFDQRGVSRLQDGNWDGLVVCDIGAYEFVSPPIRDHVYLPLMHRD